MVGNVLSLKLLLYLLVLALQIVYISAQETLAINQTRTIDTSSLTSNTFRLPQTTTSELVVTIALCGNLSDGTRFFVTNNTAIADPSASSGNTDDVFEIVVNGNGFGNFTLLGDGGGVFAISKGSDDLSLEVGLSDGEPMHELLTELPLLGDTTANQALIFSPAFLPQNITEPTYPNYTLPSANNPFPDSTNSPSVFPNFTLIVGPTAAFPDFNATSETFSDGSPLTACSIKSRGNITINSNTSAIDTSLVLRDTKGWRTQWFFSGLQPLTNYTVFVIQDDVKVSGPINIVTKSAFFACPLAHSLPYCPEVSYAVPLPFPDSAPAYTADNMPTNISEPLLSYMTNFTQSLLTFACGRDWYSPLMTCADCQLAYRTWLCSVQLPRCGESPTTSSTTTSASSTATATQKKKKRKRSYFWRRDENTQTVLSTSSLSPSLKAQNSSDPDNSRNANLPALTSNEGNWTELLPCLETCNAVERACPNFLGIACPVPRFNAYQSYGVGFIDGDAKDPGGTWLQKGGKTGVAQDRWGNVWCNGPGLV